MSTTLTEAEARAAVARARLAQTVNGLQDRLSPKTLAREAAETLVEKGDKVAQAGANTLRENPGKAAGAVVLVAAFLARHRIAASVRKGKRNLKR